MIGIYKITSPSGRVYIGQSIDIKRRFKAYKKSSCKEQTKLFNSFNKYGVEAHVFDIVIECSVSELNDLERYYQEVFNTIKSGLNCILTKTNDRCGEHSEETKAIMRAKRKDRVITPETCKKISESNKGRVFTDEHRANISKARKGLISGDKNPMYGKVGAMKGKTGILSPNFGRKISESEREHRKKIFARGGNSQAKKLIDTETKQIFDCVRDASEYIGCSYGHLRHVMSGARPNKTNLIYL